MNKSIFIFFVVGFFATVLTFMVIRTSLNFKEMKEYNVKEIIDDEMRKAKEQRQKIYTGNLRWKNTK